MVSLHSRPLEKANCAAAAVQGDEQRGRTDASGGGEEKIRWHLNNVRKVSAGGYRAMECNQLAPPHRMNHVATMGRRPLVGPACARDRPFVDPGRRKSMLATRITLASAAAIVAVTGGFAAHAQQQASAEKVVHCYGTNSCKGTSDCATASTSCKGQNACKGQGFKALSVKACKDAGGRLTEK
jgi:uncharacterized membrane protein